MRQQPIKYQDGPIGEIALVPDFLPAPENLAFKEKTVKVTLSLSKSTLDFFKGKAAHHQAKYQRMIRILLDKYAAHYAELGH